MTPIVAKLRPLFAELDQRQTVLARLGWLMLAIVALCLVAASIDSRTINGVSVWVKPAKFAASFVAWFWTMAWAWGFLAPTARRGWIARIILWGTVLAAAFEQSWILLRAGLGQPSHFAADRVGELAYRLMGLGALSLVLLAFVLGVLVLSRGDPRHRKSWRLAVGLGLAISGILGGATGATISVMMTPHVGGTATDAANFAPFFWSRDGGDLRVAHFLAVHAMQVLPAVALMSRSATPAVIGVAACVWIAVTAGAYAAALAGISMSP
ncbi:hypothetical protein [Roseomonas rosulenta]|uniref:hypothetical protein n=1 Tax=Roseomonas rosulenta TaxID=2748667 RepID=UPI0018DF3921|nr:hypothetical protein [Roseomonas rosulenta]